VALRRVLIDTSSYAAFKRGDSAALSALQKANLILLPTVVLGELLAVFEAGGQRQRNRDELKEFQRSPRVQLVGATAETAERYAVIYTYLRDHSRAIPTNNLWIAAHAMEQGSILLTADSHFLDLPQIVVRYLDTLRHS
jgi:tRNA(fMet)-specific endonuclease VapC